MKGNYRAKKESAVKGLKRERGFRESEKGTETEKK